MASILRAFFTQSHACPCCAPGANVGAARDDCHRCLAEELGAVRDISAFVLLSASDAGSACGDADERSSEFSFCASDFDDFATRVAAAAATAGSAASGRVSAATTVVAAEDVGEEEAYDEDQDQEKEEEPHEAEERDDYDEDGADTLADVYESKMFNQKRGRMATRSSGATKASHKLEAKQRRQLRSGHVAVKSNTKPVHSPAGSVRYGTSQRGGYTLAELRSRVYTLRHGGRPAPWHANAPAAAFAYHHHHNHHHHHQAVPVTLQPFVLHEGRGGLEALLAQLQHRELSAEDYELLLRLDESLKPKTVATTLLDLLPVHEVVAGAPAAFCPVCQCDIEAGERAKTLPCGHAFHVACIDQWLSSAADRCPIDSQPLC